MAYEEIGKGRTSISSKWQTATIAVGAKTTGAINLEGPYRRALIVIPADMKNATYAVGVSNDGTTFTKLHNLYLTVPADIAVPKQKAVVIDIGGAQYLEITGTSNEESTAKTIYVRGI